MSKEQNLIQQPIGIQNVISNNEMANENEFSDEMSAAEIKTRSVKGVMAFAVRTAALQGVSLLAFGLLSGLLTVQDFGVFAIVNSVTNLFTFISDIGLAASLVQKKESPTLKELRTTFTVQQVLSTVIFAIVVLLTPYWKTTQHLDGAKLILLYAMAGSYWMASLKTIPSILLERKLRFDTLAIPAIVENITFYGVVIVMAWKGYGISSYIYGVLARGILGIITIYALQRWPIGFDFDLKTFKSMARIGAKFQLNDFIATIKDQLFILFISARLGDEKIGFITWAQRPPSFPFQFTVNNITAVSFSTFSRLQDDTLRLKKAIEKSMYFISLVAFPALAAIAVFIFPLVSLVEKYHKWEPATWSVVWFCVSVAWSAVSTPLSNTLNAIGQINKSLYLQLMWTGFTWAVIPVFIYYFGFTGYSLASAVIGSACIVVVFVVKKYVPIQVIPQLWRQATATTVMILFSYFTISMWSRSFIHFAAGLLLAGLVYSGVFLAIGWRSLQTELRSLGILK